MPETPESPSPERRSTPRRPGPMGEGDWPWIRGQITELWRAFNAVRPGHTDEQLRRIVREEVDAAINMVQPGHTDEQLRRIVREEADAAVASALPDFTVIKDLAPDLVQMVADDKRRRQDDLESAAVWSDWRARIDAAVKAIPQLFVLLGVLLTVAQLNRQGTVPNAVYWIVVAGVVLYGVWVIYGQLLRPARPRPPQPPLAEQGHPNQDQGGTRS